MKLIAILDWHLEVINLTAIVKTLPQNRYQFMSMIRLILMSFNEFIKLSFLSVILSIFQPMI